MMRQDARLAQLEPTLGFLIKSMILEAPRRYPEVIRV